MNDAQATAKMQAMISDLRIRYETRRSQLQRMKPAEIRTIANRCGLPPDLNTSERIKYILNFEFPAR
jgi:hypothetical protein